MPADTVITVGADAIGDPALDDAFSGQLDAAPGAQRGVCARAPREAAGSTEAQTGASS